HQVQPGTVVQLNKHAWTIQKKLTETNRQLDKKVEKQGSSGVVPDGFILRLVWEVVPWVRLGYGYGTGMFWELGGEERTLIREKFREGLMKLFRRGIYYPNPASGQNLVWDRENTTLYVYAY
ncbi:hypothetical protein BO78DRAFT_271855, partial [Aspergillus sclerotiicarbonarius CBS 121057]